MSKQRVTPKKATRTPPWRPVFLDLLRRMGNVSLAAKTVGHSRNAVYRARAKSETFARQWDDAIEEACDVLEAEARRRAFSGVDEPVFHKGEVVGHVRKYSDTLLIFLLKGYRPERFRDGYRPGDGEGDWQEPVWVLKPFSPAQRLLEPGPPPEPPDILT